MSYSGYEQEETTKRCRPKLRCKMRICRPSSPKFWQLIHNDIPLLISIPVALVYELIDPYTAFGAAFITVIDSISMLVYLCHDDETDIEATGVYELIHKAKQENSVAVQEIDSD